MENDKRERERERNSCCRNEEKKEGRVFQIQSKSSVKSQYAGNVTKVEKHREKVEKTRETWKKREKH